MNIFDVGVWSSLDREKTSAFSQSFFDRYYRKYNNWYKISWILKRLLFIAATNREDYEGNKAYYDEHPIAVKRVWK